jgi:hypothetical protein
VADLPRAPLGYRAAVIHARFVSIALLAAACGGNSNGPGDDTGDDTGDDAPAADAEACLAPDMLVVLDRTGTMHRDLLGQSPPDTPDGHAAAKLTQAIAAVEALVGVTGIDQTLRFGLSLFPRDPGSCLTLSERLQNQKFTNPACEAAEIVVAPELGTSASIAGTLDPETTTICYSTPTGSALVTARDELTRVQAPNVDQYIMLVTDGADFYATCPEPDPLVVLRELYAAGIKTFVVGFGAQDTTEQGVNPPMLNRMACAGGTAQNFATACTAAPSGGFDAVDPDGDRIYYDAADAAELSTALAEIAGSVCCGCIL